MREKLEAGRNEYENIEHENTRLVAPGIWKITLPIPFPLRSVNVYALIGEDGWTLIDAGIGTTEARTALHMGLQQAGLSIHNLRSIVLTHHHPDHIGLSAELQEKSGAIVYMHPIDEQGARRMSSEAITLRMDRLSRFFVSHGLSHPEFWYATLEPEVVRSIMRLPVHEVFELVEDGQEIELAHERYQVLWVPGHCDGLISLFRKSDGIFLSADHVLPRITPNISLYPEADRLDPLGDYLDSLQKVKNLPVSLVLPGHGEPFYDLAQRVEEIAAHHEERLQDVLHLLTERPRHANALTQSIFAGRLANADAQQMALAEILAHLEYLRFRGKVRQYQEDGIIFYAHPDVK